LFDVLLILGIIPNTGAKLAREQLEEVVMATQQTLGQTEAAARIPFCCFNGGADVWVDIGDKRLGVECLQKFFARSKKEDIGGQNCIHWGDQFLSLGSNDFKARLASTTVWIANPAETNTLLEELLHFLA
jgi:IMP and pyridine-specific 5'-nucleotidase